MWPPAVVSNRSTIADLDFTDSGARVTSTVSSTADFFLSPAQWGFVTGFGVASYLNVKVRDVKWLDWAQERSVVQLHRLCHGLRLLVAFCLFLLLTPLILVLLAAFAAYRQLATLLIRAEMRGQFAGMMEGHDAVWALETPATLSVINILAVLEGDRQSGDILLALRKRLAAKLLGKRQQFPKMFYRRMCKWGYPFWTRATCADDLTIEDHIRYVDIASESDGALTDTELRDWIGTVSNTRLPLDHTTTWEILVSKKTLKGANCSGNAYPVSIYRYNRRKFTMNRPN